MSWFFEGSAYSDPEEAKRALAELVEERDNLSKTVTDLEELIEVQKKEITDLEDQVGAAQQSAAKMVEQSRSRMQDAKSREAELEAVRRRLELTTSICDLSHNFRRIAQGIEAVKTCIFPPPLVIAGPSGVGKASLITKLFAEFGRECRIPISHTSRAPAPEEQHGVHYMFVKRAEMEAGIEKGAFVEVADVDGDLYGTSMQALNDVRNEGKIAVLHIDIAGLEQLQSSKLGPVSVWVAPPSLASLQERMISRGLTDQEEVAQRLGQAEKDMRRAKELERLLDFVLVNHDLDQAYAQLKSLLNTVPAYQPILQDPPQPPPQRPPRTAAPSQAPPTAPQTAPPVAPASDPPPAPASPDAAASPPVAADSQPEPTPAEGGAAAAGAEGGGGEGGAAAGAEALLRAGSSGLLLTRKPLVLAGPSGVGKGTLIDRLLREFPRAVGLCVSHTTRAPRPGEEDGVHYHFVEHAAMAREVEAGAFVEHAEVHGNVYGTSKQAVVQVAKRGRVCVLDIDVQGCRSVRACQLPATFVFVAPPSMEALEARLRGRGTETEDKILKRLANAQREMEARDEAGLFDHVLVNDDLDAAYARLKACIAPQLSELGVAVMAKRPRVVFVLGGPGAGKGTQCANIVQQFGWEHLSAGDLLRAEQATDSDNAKLIQEYIREGKIVPVEITIKLLVAAMERSGGSSFLIDGFPRSADNQDGWERVVGGQAEVCMCLELQCGEEELQRRLLKRGETSGRADDNLESITKRFKAFQEQTLPVMDLYRQKGLLRSIDSAHPVDHVWGQIKALFQELDGGSARGGEPEPSAEASAAAPSSAAAEQPAGAGGV